MRPQEGTYPEYYGYYIPLVEQNDVLSALKENGESILSFIGKIPESKANFAYAEGKWTVKEVLIHLIDTERIFSYRALRFARRDAQKPLSYDENQYAPNSKAAKRTLVDIAEEFESVRRASITLFKSFSEEALQQMGPTTAGNTSVNAIGFTICGHAIHHLAVISERYLKN
jgi:hypothetical protein